MKSLYLFRHGKSDWGADYETDHDRPLAKRGRKAAKAMGTWLRKTKQEPDYVLCSTAVRTRQTLARAAKRWTGTPEVVYTDALYEATPEAVIGLLLALPITANDVMVVGHEPTSSALLSHFVGEAAVRFPTAAIARIDFPILSWHQIEGRFGELIWFLPPRLMP
ncbi:MAG: histidine phosphatase family protein [Bacteroidota bacterium]